MNSEALENYKTQETQNLAIRGTKGRNGQDTSHHAALEECVGAQVARRADEGRVEAEPLITIPGSLPQLRRQSRNSRTTKEETLGATTIPAGISKWDRGDPE